MPQLNPAADPGNAGPDSWSEAFSDADLAALLGLVDNPDNLVTAGLAGTLYDPGYSGPGTLGSLATEGDSDGGR